PGGGGRVEDADGARAVAVPVAAQGGPARGTVGERGDVRGAGLVAVLEVPGGGAGVEHPAGSRVLELKGAQVEAAVDDARQEALSGTGQAGDAGVAGAVGRTARLQRHRRRGAAVVPQQAELRVGSDGDDAGGKAGPGEVVRLDEVGAAGDRRRVRVVAV